MFQVHKNEKTVNDWSKNGFYFSNVMSCFMHVMSHAHVMLHVTSHILYVNDTSLSLWSPTKESVLENLGVRLPTWESVRDKMYVQESGSPLGSQLGDHRNFWNGPAIKKFCLLYDALNRYFLKNNKQQGGAWHFLTRAGQQDITMIERNLLWR